MPIKINEKQLLKFNRAYEAIMDLQVKDDHSKHKFLPKEVFLSEYKTIQITAPRQSGKTSWLYSKFLSMKDESIFIFRTKLQLESFLLHNEVTDPEILGKIFHLGDLQKLSKNPTALFDKTPIVNHVFVDEFKFTGIAGMERDKFYEIVSRFVSDSAFIIAV